MSRTGKASAPWTRRAMRRELPTRDYTGRLATDPATLAVLASRDIVTRPRTYTVADLQRAARRENGEDL